MARKKSAHLKNSLAVPSMKCFELPSDSEDEIFEEQVCPDCGPAGGIEASDDGNRDQSCGTCGKVLLQDGKKVKRSPLRFPRIDLFQKKFPDVFVANLKQKQVIKSLDIQFVDQANGDIYAYNNVDGWKKMVNFDPTSRLNIAPKELKDLFPGTVFKPIIPNVQYKDSDGNVYGKFENDGWKIIPPTKYLTKITTG